MPLQNSIGLVFFTEPAIFISLTRGNEQGPPRRSMLYFNSPNTLMLVPSAHLYSRKWSDGRIKQILPRIVAVNHG